MLGLSLICDLTSPIDDRLVTRLADGNGNDIGHSTTSIVWHDSQVLLLSSGYPEYPIRVHETGDYLICVEGRIYQIGEPPWVESLAGIGIDIVSGEGHKLARAARCLGQVDGDFIVALQDRRSRNLVIYNDALGRLPIYVYRTDSAVVVSRDLAFISRVTGKARIDRLGSAEYLLYGYPLGPRTLLDGAERLPAAGVIQVRRLAKEITVSSLIVPSVASDSGVTSKTLQDVARELSETFKQSCTARGAGAGNRILSLSGGLDSRSVAAGLRESCQSATAVTLATNPSEREARLASKVASVLELNWRRYAIHHPTGADLLRLLRMKSGLNYLLMASILHFLDSLQSDFGRSMIFLTGDGGDKIFPDHRPTFRIRSQSGLVKYVLARHSIFPISMVAALTGVSFAEITNALEERIRSYPEESLDEKYTHYLIFERAFKWAFEGEDRNRHFFWSAAPLYGLAVFRKAMSCPAELKADYALYQHFLESLSPKLIDVESTTCGASLRFEGRPLRQLCRAAHRWTRDLAPLSFKRRWKSFTAQPVAEQVVRCLREQFAPESPVTGHLSASYATAILNAMSPMQAYLLLTLTSAIEYMTIGDTTLEHYGDALF